MSKLQRDIMGTKAAEAKVAVPALAPKLVPATSQMGAMATFCRAASGIDLLTCSARFSRRRRDVMPVFNAANIANLFGAEAAEDEPDERFRQYFFYNKTYDDLVSSLPIRILVGHKGVGKSALLKRGRMHDADNNVLAISVTPGDVAAVSGSHSTADFVRLVEYWKQGLLAIIARHVLGEAANDLLTKEKMGGFARRVTSLSLRLLR